MSIVQFVIKIHSVYLPRTLWCHCHPKEFVNLCLANLKIRERHTSYLAATEHVYNFLRTCAHRQEHSMPVRRTMKCQFLQIAPDSINSATFIERVSLVFISDFFSFKFPHKMPESRTILTAYFGKKWASATSRLLMYQELGGSYGTREHIPSLNKLF